MFKAPLEKCKCEFTGVEIKLTCSWEHVSQKFKHAGEYFSKIKMVYSVGIEIAPLSGIIYDNMNFLAKFRFVSFLI